MTTRECLPLPVEWGTDDDAMELTAQVSVVDVLRHYEKVELLAALSVDPGFIDEDGGLLLQGPSLFVAKRESRFELHGSGPREPQQLSWQDGGLDHQLGFDSMALVLHLDATGSYSGALARLRMISAEVHSVRQGVHREVARLLGRYGHAT